MGLDVITEYRAGHPVVLIDQRAAEGGARLIVAAALVDALTMSFLVRHTSGYAAVALPARRCDELGLPALGRGPDAHDGGQAAVSVDAADGVSTGISARDRAYTARLLADPTAGVDAFTRPGHLVTMRVSPDAQMRRSPAAAALQVARESWLAPASVICHLASDRGPLLTAAEGLRFASVQHLAVAAVDEFSISSELAGVA